jgi:Signal transduction histidine kinase
MLSIRKRLTFILVFCTITAVLLSTLFVNKAVDSTFNKYMADNQNKRNERILGYFEEIYKKDKKWTESSGKELQHEGYMSNYCLTLLDENKKQIWGMDPKDISYMKLTESKDGSGRGEYKTDTFELKVEGKVVGYIQIGQYEPVLLSEEDINFKNSINKNIAVSVLIALSISILVSLMISRQFSNPIKEVSDTSVSLSRGKYEARSASKSNVFEINNLIKSINILGEKLMYQDDLRKRLISDISHEIRTPLNVLQNNLEAMIDGIFLPTTERLNNLNDEVIRFGKLLNNLNSLKQLEDEDMKLKYEKIFLDELIESVYRDFLIHAKSKNIKLSLEIMKEEKYVILGDKDKLRQVFINILSNAIKFTNNEGSVWIKLSYNKTQIFVTIKDTGIGIKNEDLPFIFERLYRADKSRHEIEGSGIGLTIAKKIINLHSGIIEVDSKEGKGSSFTICLNKQSLIKI